MFWEYLLLTILISFVFSYLVINRLSKCEKNVCVVVLGDLGRSPRMQYHCISLAREDFNVDVVAYAGSTPCEELRTHEKIQIHHLSEPLAIFSVGGIPTFLRYATKSIWQCVTLGFCLLTLPKSAFHIVQNPPGVPTLAVVWLVCVIRSSQFIIDWHNYTYTILSLVLPLSHPLVKFTRWYEKIFGYLAKQSLCVTKAMQEDLLTHWNIKSHVLYDRPPEMFRPCDLATSHDLFTKLSRHYSCLSGSDPDSTRFTEVVCGKVRLKDDRPALVVSSTSWTEDEDFSVLLDALNRYDAAAKISDNRLPEVVLAITGKGPLKEYYRKRISEKDWTHITVCMPWLEPHDYPLLLGSADLGVCLHQSSSGLDLPMKVVDMFACGLPVCAINFFCLHELVTDGVNGLVFDSSTQLAQQITDLLRDFPIRTVRLKEFRHALTSFRNHRWHDNWTRVVLPMLSDV